MRLWFRRAWEWWRRDCIPVSMLAFVVMIGWASFQFDAISESARWSAVNTNRMSSHMSGIASELAPGLGSGVTDHISYISSALSGVESEVGSLRYALSDGVRVQCSN